MPTISKSKPMPTFSHLHGKISAFPENGFRVFRDRQVANPVDRVVKWGDDMQAVWATAIKLIEDSAK